VLRGLRRRVSICFHNARLTQEAGSSFRPLWSHLLFCETGSWRTGNVSSPLFQPRYKLKPFYYLKSCGFFQKIQDKYKKTFAFPSLSVRSNNKRDDMKTFHSSHQGCLCQTGAEGVRGLMSLRAEEVLWLNFTRQLFHQQHIFPLCPITWSTQPVETTPQQGNARTPG